MNTSRRNFVRAAGAGVLGLAASRALGTTPTTSTTRRPRVAALVTEFTYRSHAHVILENFLEPYPFNGELIDGGIDIASLCVDQFPAGRDMARDVARRYGIPIYPTIGEALQLGGTKLAVDGVLSIAEHGSYPVNERLQVTYPRKRFFEEIVACFSRSDRVVPVFNDKHFTYRWDWAAEMMETARRMRIPLMAGSSVPLAQRMPEMELPAGANVEEAVAIHGGTVEGYDFHGIEVVQSIVEARRGGETGVARVRFVTGDDVWPALKSTGRSLALAEAAMSAETPGMPLAPGSLPELGRRGEEPPHAILIDFRDGLRATVLKVGRNHSRWNFACRVAGEPKPLVTRFHVGPWKNRNLFKALAHAIGAHVRTGVAPYPVERTLLATGILCAAMDSRFEGSKPVETPQLAIAYQPTDWRAMRETGASWKLITDDTPEPQGIGMRSELRGGDRK